MFLVFCTLFETISGKCIFNYDVHIDNQSTATVNLPNILYYRYCTAKKSVLYLINVFQPSISKTLHKQWHKLGKKCLEVCSNLLICHNHELSGSGFPAFHMVAVLYM